MPADEKKVPEPLKKKKSNDYNSQSPRKTPVDKIRKNIILLKSASCQNSNEDAVKKCLETISIYVENVIKEPSNSKYRKIKITREAY